MNIFLFLFILVIVYKRHAYVIRFILVILQTPGAGPSSTNDSDGNAHGKKRKKDTQDDSSSLEDRVSSLEKSTRVEVVQELKDKVRVLCMQAEPSTPLILLTLEELAKVARRGNHEEADMFEELLRQAIRYQTKLDLPSLCLSVMGGKAADIITKAVSKCLKVESKSVESKKEVSQPKPEDSPLYNLYPPQQAYQPQPYYNFGYMRGFRGRPSQFRPRGGCHFCGSTSHMVKDCADMKEAKEKQFKKQS